ncbi:hypothetical protein [uncultured Ilyobacter sp.]|uniref:hypothetical protein n=1 Tax=uncultured Ilyobacter sp. TaxID=544433 RepID=UPI0029C04C1D|nr:hypothetical protein [uncultured Ilyobacter sp.]
MNLSDFGSWSSIISLIIGLVGGVATGTVYVYKKSIKLGIIDKSKCNSFWSFFSLINIVNQNSQDKE